MLFQPKAGVILSMAILDGQGHLFPSPFQFWKEKDAQLSKSEYYGRLCNSTTVLKRMTTWFFLFHFKLKKLWSGKLSEFSFFVFRKLCVVKGDTRQTLCCYLHRERSKG